MNENKLKHLEFIHNTINRMSTNSFIIKGWLITLISALFVFVDIDVNGQFMVVIWMTVPMFWYINALFLQIERKYRALYNQVRTQDLSLINFSMNTDDFNGGYYSIWSCLISKTIWPLYVTVILIELIIIYFILK